MKIDNGNADFLKSMLSPRREHRFRGPEGPKMEEVYLLTCELDAVSEVKAK